MLKINTTTYCKLSGFFFYQQVYNKMLLDITVNFLSISNIQAMSLLVSVSCGQYKNNFTVCFTEGTLNDQQVGKHM